MESQVVTLRATPVDEKGKEFFRNLNASVGRPEAEIPSFVGVIAARSIVDEIVEEHAEIDPSAPVTLDLTEIEIITTSGASQFITHWPELNIENANKDVEQCFELAREQHKAINEDNPTTL